ncbi:hypothetical protein EJ110_NYTH48363 [Nymphaea thermarum]|nr:hypothetical protein EJ110_NYTH48363 [Nymphaea thermarum]
MDPYESYVHIGLNCITHRKLCEHLNCIPKRIEQKGGEIVRKKEKENLEDSLVWSDNGKASFKAGEVINKCRIQGVKESWRRNIWASYVPTKSYRCSYIACEGRLPTLDRIQRTGMHLANCCSFCYCAEETNAHVLINCKIAKEVWRYIAAKFDKVNYLQGEIADSFKRWIQAKITGKWKRRSERLISAIQVIKTAKSSLSPIVFPILFFSMVYVMFRCRPQPLPEDTSLISKAHLRIPVLDSHKSGLILSLTFVQFQRAMEQARRAKNLRWPISASKLQKIDVNSTSVLLPLNQTCSIVLKLCFQWTRARPRPTQEPASQTMAPSSSPASSTSKLYPYLLNLNVFNFVDPAICSS